MWSKTRRKGPLRLGPPSHLRFDGPKLSSIRVRMYLTILSRMGATDHGCVCPLCGQRGQLDQSVLSDPPPFSPVHIPMRLTCHKEHKVTLWSKRAIGSICPFRSSSILSSSHSDAPDMPQRAQSHSVVKDGNWINLSFQILLHSLQFTFRCA